MIPLASLLQSLPRLLSTSAFLRAMLAQCECPAIGEDWGMRMQGAGQGADRSRLSPHPASGILRPLSWFFLRKFSGGRLLRDLLRWSLRRLCRFLRWWRLFGRRLLDRFLLRTFGRGLLRGRLFLLRCGALF